MLDIEFEPVSFLVYLKPQCHDGLLTDGGHGHHQEIHTVPVGQPAHPVVVLVVIHKVGRVAAVF